MVLISEDTAYLVRPERVVVVPSAPDQDLISQLKDSGLYFPYQELFPGREPRQRLVGAAVETGCREIL